jgi:sugar phosphate isomerase/epimerase
MPDNLPQPLMERFTVAHNDIRIGTMAGKGAATADYIAKILPHGFETFEINFWQQIPDEVDLRKLARQVRDVVEQHGGGATVSALGMYGNPVESKQVARDWRRLIDAAEHFGCDVVMGFAGCLTGKPVPDAIAPWRKVFDPLAKRAADKGLRLAFENCPMGGGWDAAKYNIAFCEAAWERMFDALADASNVGLAWEPAHQMYQLVEPIGQLRRWVNKVFIVHGKDASIYWDVIHRYGISGGHAWNHHRTPGFGDTNWTDVISILRQNKFRGAINIEGWHDPVYRGELEMTGQVHALRYLKHCRGGEFVPNP